MPENEWGVVSKTPLGKQEAWAVTGRVNLDRPAAEVDTARAAGEQSIAEGKDMALSTLPTLGALIASHATGAGEVADVAMLTARFGPAIARLVGLGLRGSTAALGAAGGSISESALRSASGDPNAPKSLGEAAGRATNQANEFFKGQMVGEIMVGAAKWAAPAVAKVGQAASSVSRRLPGGRMVMESIASHKADVTAASLKALQTEGEAVKEQFVQGLSSISPEEMYGKAGALPNHFNEAFNSSSSKLKEAAQLIGKDVSTDVQSLRAPIIAMEKARTKTGEPLISEFTPVSSEYRDVTKAAVRGSEQKSQVVGELIDAPSAKPGLVPPDALARNPVKVLIDFVRDGEKAPLDLVMEARGNISERLYDPATPKDAKKLYEKLVPPGRNGPVDSLIKKTMEEASPGSSKAWDTYLQFHANGAKLKEGALYTAMERNPTALPKYIVPMDPSRVTDLRNVTELAGKPEVFDETRRRWLESMLTDKSGELDLGNFRANLKNYGDGVVNNLFATSAEKGTLNRLKSIGDKINAIQNDVGVTAQKKQSSLMQMVGLVSASTVGGGTGALMGHSVGAGLTGAGSLLAVGYGLPYMVVKVAENPKTAVLFERALNHLDNPKVVMDFVRAVKVASKATVAAGKSISGMQASH